MRRSLRQSGQGSLNQKRAKARSRESDKEIAFPNERLERVSENPKMTLGLAATRRLPQGFDKNAFHFHFHVFIR